MSQHLQSSSMNENEGDNRISIPIKSNKYPSQSKRVELEPTWIWSCSNCNDHNMTTFIASCPGCGHIRCTECPLESGLPRYTHKSKLQQKPKERPSSPLPRDAIAAPNKKLKESEASSYSTPAAAPLFIPASSSSSAGSSPTTQSSPQAVFTPKSGDVNTETEAETDDDEEEEADDDVQGLGHESETSGGVFGALEAHLVSILGFDFDFIAEIIPRIYESIRTGFSHYDGSSTIIAEDGESGVGDNVSASSGNTVQPHGRDPTRSNTGRQRGGNSQRNQRTGDNRVALRTSRPDRDRGPSRLRTFACPFHKYDQRKYHPLNDVKYRTCFGPGPVEHELRRMKYHLREQQHNPRDGESEISDEQRKEIEQLLRLKKGKPLPGAREWYSIWRILFPGVPEPLSPYDEFEVYPRDLESVINVLGQIYERDIERRLVPSFDYFVQSLRQAYQSTISRVSHDSTIIPSLMGLDRNFSQASTFPVEPSLAAIAWEPDTRELPQERMQFDVVEPSIPDATVPIAGLSIIEAGSRARPPDFEQAVESITPELNILIEMPSMSLDLDTQPCQYSEFSFENTSTLESSTPDNLVFDDGSMDMIWNLADLESWKAGFNNENSPAMEQQQLASTPPPLDILGLEDQQFNLDYRDENSLAAALQSEIESEEVRPW